MVILFLLRCFVRKYYFLRSLNFDDRKWIVFNDRVMETQGANKHAVWIIENDISYLFIILTTISHSVGDAVNGDK